MNVNTGKIDILTRLYALRTWGNLSRTACDVLDDASAEIRQLRSQLEAGKDLAIALQHSAAELNAAIRIGRTLEIDSSDIDLWAEQVKVDMQALCKWEETR